MKQFIKSHATNGVWFACSDDQYPVINELIKEGFFKPLTELVGNIATAKHWFVPTNFEIKDLPTVFTHWAINSFGIGVKLE